MSRQAGGYQKSGDRIFPDITDCCKRFFSVVPRPGRDIGRLGFGILPERDGESTLVVLFYGLIA